jgi:integrase
MERKRRGRGEGSIYQESSGRWVACVSKGLDPKGRRRRTKIRGKTKKEVADKLDKMKQATYATAGSNLTAGQWLTRWLDNRTSIGVTTKERWETVIRLHLEPHLSHVRLTRLEPLHIEQLYADLHNAAVSAYTIHQAGVLLSQALKSAVKLKMIPLNPALAVETPKKPERAKITVLDAGQVKRMLQAAQGRRCYPLLALAIGTGMRQGEILGLHWPDIDFADSTLTVHQSMARAKGSFLLKAPKTKSSRRKIALPPFVVEALNEHRAKMLAKGFMDCPVFCARSGKPLARHNVLSQYLRPVLADAGLPLIRFHDLRHTHASQLLSAGHSIRAVAARLGHSKTTTTADLYGHVMPADDAALAKRIDETYG